MAIKNDDLVDDVPDVVGPDDLEGEYVLVHGEPAPDFDDLAEVVTGDEDDWTLFFRVNAIDFPDPIVLPQDGRIFVVPTADGIAKLRAAQALLNAMGT